MSQHCVVPSRHPDSGDSGIPAAWRDFSHLDWDGSEALPVMDPADYVKAMAVGLAASWQCLNLVSPHHRTSSVP